MKRKSLKRWVGPCLLSPTLGLGCQYAHYSAPITAPHAPAVSYVYTEGHVATQSLDSLQAGGFLAKVEAPLPRSLVAAPQPVVATAAKPQAPAEGTLAANPNEPVGQALEIPVMPAMRAIVARADTPTEEVRTPSAPRPAPQIPDPQIRRVESRPPDHSPVMPPPMVEPSKVPAAIENVTPVEPPPPAPAVTASAGGFGHAEDYSWLCGELQYTKSKGWRLRYAGLDQEDTYGGSVTLPDESRLAGFQDGQMVRVQGHLQAEGKAIAPPYRIEAIEPLK
jgi:hypothetical protein